ncbi:acriflavin resistance protein (plasmid) [Sinorhizobium meliloti WSM1022]|uniref:ABC transporter permease n=1 Tax=Rhizobium meliloti TaxID=382 RepID=UPI00040BAA69|nr:acriflavin resistance protein [Sinorhizobium meliloti]MDW9627298.1 acriflavin resistance protein [Sinorhizobium meliloti]MDW9793679.1 acriflavin resistance protein [Sinorhizobium meliloti]MDW9831582.1 acriflavin resistance protein [Sinorhizobium meliloti]MDW9898894.1 acriflavin resistance protein [Sinorhizobium meliloti]MDW9997971.1 acriflavin resistance protein [Sinorhizobium meliloti]
MSGIRAGLASTPYLNSIDGPALLATAPFFIFAIVMMVMPTMALLVTAFVDKQGALTLANFVAIATPEVADAFMASAKISGATAVLGTLFGLILALTVGRGMASQKVKAAVMTFCGVASHFSGIPLAFAFIATLGRLGLVTIVLRNTFGIDIYAAGFDLASFSGLALTYLFFQVPIALTIIMPAIERLSTQTREAAEILGATTTQYWRFVGLPILWPTILGSLALLFANAFGGIATAYALTGTAVNVIPILLYAQIRGDVLHNEQLGAVLALLMVLVMTVAISLYLMLRVHAERWLK